jgi:hypothetical protein
MEERKDAEDKQIMPFECARKFGYVAQNSVANYELFNQSKVAFLRARSLLQNRISD